MSKSKNQISALLAAIERKPERVEKIVEPKLSGSAEPEREATAIKVPLKPQKNAEKEPAKKGSAFQFWMHHEDRKLLRELSAWLAGQGIRASDSMLIRAVLRQARTGDSLIAAYWEASKMDWRIKREGE